MPLNTEQSAKKLVYYAELINKAFTRIRISEIRNMEETKKPLNSLNIKDNMRFNDMITLRLQKLSKV